MSGISDSGATLTITDHAGDWWYTVAPRSGSPGTCTAAPSGAYVVNLSNLASSTPHTFTAYSDSACSTEIVSVGFSTAG